MLLQDVHSSGKILNYHNQNQIERMNAWNDQLKLELKDTKNLTDRVKQVFEPF